MTPSQRKYYGGPKATTNEVRVLSATDFASLVSGYYNVPEPLPTTFEEFHKLDKNAQFKVKNGPYVCAARFKDGTTIRGNDAAERMNLVTIDLDTPEDGDGRYLRDMLAHPETVLEMLHPFNALIHTTATSTPERPRLRIVVDADIDPEHLRRGVRTIIRMAGIPNNFKGIVESSTVSQPAFLPVLFKGQTLSPVLATRTTGRTFTEADLDEETADGEDHVQRYAWVGDDSVCGLDQLPIADLTVADIADVFEHLDPDMPYPEWVGVAASLRHQFRTEDAAHEAYDLFDTWSSKGTKYHGRDATYAKWQAVKPEAAGRRSRTIRCVFYSAAQAGWKNTRVLAVTQQTYADWLANETDVTGICEEACKRIAATPFRTEITEALMIEQARRRVKELKGPSVTKETFQKQIRAEVSKMKREAADAPTPGKIDNMPGWLRPFCFCGPTNKFIHMGLPEGVGAYAPAAFDMNFSREMILDPTAPPNTPKMRASTFAMDTCQIKRVHGCVYDPRQGGDDAFFEDGEATYFNLYNRASVPAEDEHNSKRAGEIFTRHLRYLIREEEYVQIMLEFFARIVQQPGQKIIWVPCIQSAQGAGKGLLGSLIGSAIGEPNVGVVEGTTIFAGPWNDWAFGKQFILINELRIAGHSREDMMNRLKSFCTDPFIPRTAKFENTGKSPNVANAIAFTNFHNALAPERTERRWFVLKSPIQTVDQVEELRRSGHFAELMRLANKFGGALRHFLLNFPIPKDSPVYGTAPETIYLNQMRDLAKPKGLIATESAVKGRPVIIQEDLEERMEAYTRNSSPVTQHLYNLGYTPWNNGQPVSLGERSVTLWTHYRMFDSELDDAVALALHEMQKNGKMF